MTQLKNLQPSSEPAISELLRRRMADLPYLAFAICVSRILEQLGYKNIPLPNRRSFKGPNAMSGVDLHAWRPDQFGLLPVYIVLKRWQGPRPVHQRSINEFRGTLLRDAVPEGIIVATVGFSAKAREAANSYPGRPIRVVDGDELGRLALAHRVGLVERRDLVTGEIMLQFDEESFERLEEYAEDLRKQPKEKGARNA